MSSTVHQYVLLIVMCSLAVNVCAQQLSTPATVLTNQLCTDKADVNVVKFQLDCPAGKAIAVVSINLGCSGCWSVVAAIDCCPKSGDRTLSATVGHVTTARAECDGRQSCAVVVERWKACFGYSYSDYETINYMCTDVSTTLKPSVLPATSPPRVTSVQPLVNKTEEQIQDLFLHEGVSMTSYNFEYIAIVIVAVLLMLAVIVVVVFLLRRRKLKKSVHQENDHAERVSLQAVPIIDHEPETLYATTTLVDTPENNNIPSPLANIYVDMKNMTVRGSKASLTSPAGATTHRSKAGLSNGSHKLWNLGVDKSRSKSSNASTPEPEYCNTPCTAPPGEYGDTNVSPYAGYSLARDWTAEQSSPGEKSNSFRDPQDGKGATECEYIYANEFGKPGHVDETVYAVPMESAAGSETAILSGGVIDRAAPPVYSTVNKPRPAYSDDPVMYDNSMYEQK